MHFSWKRGRLASVAALASVVMVVSFTGAANAAEPGEEGYWHLNHEGGQPLQLRGTLAEERLQDGSGNYLQAWRGATNDQVWMDVNSGGAFQLGNTATYNSPVVVNYGYNGWMVFHTGTDNHIYYATVWLNNGAVQWSGSWQQVPGQTTRDTVSVTQMGIGSPWLYMVYRSATDDRVFGMRFYGGTWQALQNINRGLSPNHPVVTWMGVSSRLIASVRGEDNSFWLTTSDDEGLSWTQWRSIGHSDSPMAQAPSIAQASNGIVMADYVGSDGHPNWMILDQYGNPTQNWQQSADNWQTSNAVTLEAVNNAIVALLTGYDSDSYFKDIYIYY
jgi:hypothetical protein